VRGAWARWFPFLLACLFTLIYATLLLMESR